MEDETPNKWQPKESGYSHTRQNRLQEKGSKGQRLTLYNEKGIIHQEAITLINIYTPNTEAPKYIKQLLTDLKQEIDSNTIIAGDFNISFTFTWIDYWDRRSTKKPWPSMKH